MQIMIDWRLKSQLFSKMPPKKYPAKCEIGLIRQ